MAQLGGLLSRRLGLGYLCAGDACVHGARAVFSAGQSIGYLVVEEFHLVGPCRVSVLLRFVRVCATRAPSSVGVVQYVCSCGLSSLQELDRQGVGTIPTKRSEAGTTRGCGSFRHGVSSLGVGPVDGKSVRPWSKPP